MKVLEPGHIYELSTLDNEGKNIVLTFVNRETTPHGGTQNQEVIRMIIDIIDTINDRVNHCDECLRWEGNDRILKALTEAQRQLRLAILYHEQRALERKLNKEDWKLEDVPIAPNGHWIIE